MKKVESWVVFEERACSSRCAQEAAFAHYGRVTTEMLEPIREVVLRVKNFDEQEANGRFHVLREKLLPEWSAGKGWKLALGVAPEHRLHGHCLGDGFTSCDSPTKTVWARKPLGHEIVESALVREMCHAFASEGDDWTEDRWAEHMRAAAKRAASNGWAEVAAEILDEVGSNDPEERVARQANEEVVGEYDPLRDPRVAFATLMREPDNPRPLVRVAVQCQGDVNEMAREAARATFSEPIVAILLDPNVDESDLAQADEDDGLYRDLHLAAHGLGCADGANDALQRAVDILAYDTDSKALADALRAASVRW
ncbi:MAG: hypothetical protein WBG86_06175 [Polyangiales bacterium]